MRGVSGLGRIDSPARGSHNEPTTWDRQSQRHATAVVIRRIVAGLVTALAVLLVTFAVLMGFYLLTEQLGDQLAISGLRWAGRVCLIFMLIDLILLVLALAADALNR